MLKRSSRLTVLAALSALVSLAVPASRAGSCDTVALAATVSVDDALGGHLSGVAVVLVTSSGQRLDGVTGSSGKVTLRYVGTACDAPPVATALAPASSQVNVVLRITGQNPDLPPIQSCSSGPTSGASSSGKVQP